VRSKRRTAGHRSLAEGERGQVQERKIGEPHQDVGRAGALQGELGEVEATVHDVGTVAVFFDPRQILFGVGGIDAQQQPFRV
jgi:hypothetical protein